MTDVTPTPVTTENRCYRHPNRETFVRCQRCGRPICGECQTLAPVGVHCPECVREARGSAAANASATGRRFGRMLSPRGGRPLVTWAIIAVCVIVFILEIVTGLNPISGRGNSSVEQALAYYPHGILTAPWSIITVNFVHANFLHILFNMYSLLVVGAPLERFLGRARYAALFFITGIGAVVGVEFFANEVVVGASGAIFGVLGALIIFARRMGLRTAQLYVVVVLNLAIGYFVPQIAWQAHVGGLVVGLGLGYLILRTTGTRRRPAQIAGTAGIAVVLVAALVVSAIVQTS